MKFLALAYNFLMLGFVAYACFQGLDGWLLLVLIGLIALLNLVSIFKQPTIFAEIMCYLVICFEVYLMWMFWGDKLIVGVGVFVVLGNYFTLEAFRLRKQELKSDPKWKQEPWRPKPALPLSEREEG
jgi:hypothetical protein